MVDRAYYEPLSPRGRHIRLALGFGALVMLGALFAMMVANAMAAGRQSREAQASYAHTFDVLLATEALRASVNTAMRGERGYLITHDDRFLAPYRQATRDAPTLVERLARLTRDNPRQQENLANLEPRIERLFSLLERAVALRRAGREGEAVALVRDGVGMREIGGVLDVLKAIAGEEERLLAMRSRTNARANAEIEQQYYALAGVGSAFLLLAAAAAISTAGAQKRVRLQAEQLRRSATTDELTGIANRRRFMQALEREISRAARNGSPLSVAIADIDYFKRINDSFGHGGGDEVLRELARRAEAAMRTSDMVARLGGEEFAILMPETDAAEARIACERLRIAISERPVRLAGGEEARVTLSTGVALLVPGENQDKLVTRADTALYRAKESGRDRVLLAA